MGLKQLREKRASMLREAEGLRTQDGTFENDEKRAAFDAKMAEIEEIDTTIRGLEKFGVADPVVAPAPVASDASAAAAAAITGERQRASDIQSIATRAGLDAAFVTSHVQSGATIEAVRTAALEALVQRSEQGGPQGPSGHIRMGEDARDKRMRGAMNWLLVKSGVADMVARSEKVDVATLDPGEFRGMSLLDLARHSLDGAGVNTRGMDKMAVAGNAFITRTSITQTTSDFAILLENTTGKVLRAAFATAPDTWRKFAAESTNPDFRASARYRLGSFGVLDTVNEAGEFKNKPIPDGEKAGITVATKGNIINWSRQMVVNDDMGVFTRLSTMLGRAAALSVEVDVYALLAQNAGLGPTLGDGLTLFHASHGNIGTGSAISVDALDADRVLLAQQKDLNGNEFLDLRPDVILLPIGIGGTARVLNGAEYDTSVSNKFQVPNKVRGLFRMIVDSPRITGTRRYMFADPAVAPVLEVAFLEGQKEPVIETREGWRVDGTEMKVRYDYGVAAVDYRGAITNAGV